MSNFTYDKYNEILTRLEKSLEKLKKADEDTYCHMKLKMLEGI